MAEVKSKGNGIVKRLREITGADAKAYFILWKYAPDLMPKKGLKTFEDLANNYVIFKKGNTEEYCNSWLYVDEKTQKAVKWLKGILHEQRMLELYDSLYERAKEGDTNAFKALVSFGKEFFADNKEDDLAAFLQGITLPNSGADEDE